MKKRASGQGDRKVIQSCRRPWAFLASLWIEIRGYYLGDNALTYGTYIMFYYLITTFTYIGRTSYSHLIHVKTEGKDGLLIEFTQKAVVEGLHRPFDGQHRILPSLVGSYNKYQKYTCSYQLYFPRRIFVYFDWVLAVPSGGLVRESQPWFWTGHHQQNIWNHLSFPLFLWIWADLAVHISFLFPPVNWFCFFLLWSML